MTQYRIREWVDYYGMDGVYIGFSGGNDSMVLLHIAREMYLKIGAVYVDTGLEYPEVRSL
jgi:tRNA(Ile)-lysidine synthase TilS/MesJ